MASAGDVIKFTNLPTGPVESRTNICTNGNGSTNSGYFYISAPSFRLELQLVKDSVFARSGWCNLKGSYYNWDSGTWSSETQVVSVSGKPGNNVSSYLGHNCPSQSCTARIDGKYHLWRMHISMSSDTKKRIWWEIFNIGDIGESNYNSYFKGTGSTPNKIYSCGNAGNSSCSFNSTSSKYIYVASSWAQNDSSALSWFSRTANRGTKITVANCNHMSS